MKYLLKTILFHLLDILSINSLFRFLNRKKAIILWYHGICGNEVHLNNKYEMRHVQKSSFLRQLKYLKKKGYSFVTMSQLLNALANNSKIYKFVTLTFDDGFKNVMENAYPVMLQLNAKGCFYLVTDIIGGKRLLWTDYIDVMIGNQNTGKYEFFFKGEKVCYMLNTVEDYINTMTDIKQKLRSISNKERIEHMKQFNFNDQEIKHVPQEFITTNWLEIKNCDKKVLEIGSHTATHPNCTNLRSKVEFKKELKESKSKTEQMVGYDVNHFSYPAGDYNSEIIKKLKDYGYKSAVTIIPGFNDKNTDLFQLRRIGVSDNFLAFKAHTSGSYIALRELCNKLKGK
ncbi:MAG: hypothetical protein AMJ43_07255 [Coxiella sp. DG_40]|nr:MAG: hypothetical protein AMJ43_07255 [Coxiella sp. DG_40]